MPKTANGRRIYALADYTVEDISRATLPRDFARQPRIHQCYLIRRP